MRFVIYLIGYSKLTFSCKQIKILVVIGENNYLVTDTVVENTVSNQTFNQLSCVPEDSFKNDSLQQPSTSNAVNHKPSWTPIDSTKLLKSTGKHHKLTSM